MDPYLSLVTLGVADLERSRRFYSDGLGWRPMLDLEEVVFYQVGAGLALGLFPLAELGKDAGVPAMPGTSMSLAQNLGSEQEVDAAVEKARAAGAEVLKPAQKAAFGGYHAYVADPDGHRWEIAYNPGWSVQPDGTVVLTAVSPESSL